MATGDYGYDNDSNGDSTIVWNYWTSSTGPSLANASVTYYNVWPSWCATTTNTVTYTGQGLDNIWVLWNNYGQVTYGTGGIVVPAETEEEFKVRVEREAAERVQMEAAAKKREETRAAARKKASELLHAHLNAEQKKDLTEKAHFLVHTKRGVYRIRRGCQGNIDFLGKPGLQPSHMYCVHVPHSYSLPDEDQMLLQKLLLEADEGLLLKTANVTNLN